MFELSEQEQLRRASLAEMRKLGVDPYPAAEYPVSHYSSDIINNFDSLSEGKNEVCVAGRIMTRRIMGNASFFEIQDQMGRVQVYIRRDDICPNDDKTLYNTVFKKLLDIGDIVGIKGIVFKTQMGEISIHTQELTVLAKSIRPLPIVKEKDGQTFDAFTDPEQRYRQRYVDLVVNPKVRDTFIKRSKIIRG
jgi:lysyl-tRNA synthetase class 2